MMVDLEVIHYIHPLIVHFPIALLLTAVLLDGLAIILKRPALHRVALWNLCLGTVGAGVAVLTGREAAEVAKHSFEIWKVMEQHQRFGFATLIFATLASALRLVKRDQLPPSLQAVSLILMLAMAVTLSLGARLGGRLVHEFGVHATKHSGQ
ncbi:MAG: DUF2231 domain-containing protein [Candidatus Omnitrophica bacterium]|nr:DUF2231 domain-containing protein [Candidatus Omnitrophota bacterium]